MRVRIKIYDKIKYDMTSEMIGLLFYDIKSFKVVGGGSESEKIESEIDAISVDDYHEYLVLDLEDGNTATFRNSYVDMFKD